MLILTNEVILQRRVSVVFWGFMLTVPNELEAVSMYVLQIQTLPGPEFPVWGNGFYIILRQAPTF